jgi:undecaprenyl-diphosphatase
MVQKEQGSSRFFAAGAAACVSVISGVVLLAQEVFEGETRHFDEAVIAALREPGNLTNPIGPPWLEEAARDVTALGSFTILTAIVLFTAVYLKLSGRPRNAWFLVVCSSSGAIVSTVLKNLFERPRPELTAVTRVFTSSFPSGHALLSAVVFLTIGMIVARSTAHGQLKALALGTAAALTIIVGLSRIYLGVHYPTDVMAGWLIGVGWALFCWLAIESANRMRRPHSA